MIALSDVLHGQLNESLKVSRVTCMDCTAARRAAAAVDAASCLVESPSLISLSESLGTANPAQASIPCCLPMCRHC